MRADAAPTGQTGPVSGAAISLFSGAGGLDLGVERAGFSTVAAVEWDEDAANSLEKNAHQHFPHLREVLRADLYPLATGRGTGITTKDLLTAAGIGRSRPELLIGGPPCVAFSKSGF
jgi:DNA (cytosine-5)-methyltransferase 1